MLRKLLSKVLFSLLLLMGKISKTLLETIEKRSSFVLGKGFGSTSIKFEVRQLSNLWKSSPAKLLSPVIFDVGANVGDFTQLMLSTFPGSEIHAFEPSSTSYAVLNNRFANTNKVKAMNVALSNVSGPINLYGNVPGSTLSSIFPRDVDFSSIPFEVLETVPSITLDSYILGSNCTPDILKLDVEGAELEVLRGSTSTIRRIYIVQFEFGGANRDSKTYFKDFWDFFDFYNFLLFRVSPLGLIPLTQYSEYDEFFHTSNYVALNSELHKPL
jgi:FkbM family methyltransferase